MNMILAFSPFIAFVVLEQFLGTLAGLIAGALVAVFLVVRDRIRGGGELKVLEVGTALLFGGLAVWGYFLGVESWSIAGVRLRVDVSLLAVILASIVLRRPFTLQYAREQVSPEIARDPRFLKLNYVITAVWALAFVLVVAADLMLVYMPELPIKFAVLVTGLALAGAFGFTAWYPGYVSARATSLRA